MPMVCCPFSLSQSIEGFVTRDLFLTLGSEDPGTIGKPASGGEGLWHEGQSRFHDG